MGTATRLADAPAGETGPPGPGALLLRPHAPDGAGRVLATGTALAHVALEVFRLTPGAALSRHEAERECCLVVISGRARLAAGTLGAVQVGGRAGPFDGPGHAAYLPAGTEFSVVAETPCDIALAFAADRERAHPPRLIRPDDWRVTMRGAGTCLREIRDILPETAPAASLLMVEVVTPAGHWSSWPPHKHDTDDPPRETCLEEVYYHRLRGGSGFAFQRVYTDDRTLDAALAPEDGCAVLVPRGYHPVSAPPNADLWYLNAMAGPRRLWRFSTDPDFAAENMHPPHPF